MEIKLEPKNGNKIDVDYVVKFYNTMCSAWPKDYYNVYTRKYLIKYVCTHLKKIKKNSRILNAGSGGTVYNIPGKLYHLDVAENRIAHLPNHYVGGIEDLPYKDNFFDYIICVGTVINYAYDVRKAMSEFNRVLKPGGKMIIEYERSHSGLIPKKYRERDRFLFLHEYFNIKHENYLYSDRLVDSLLKKNNFKVLQQNKYQAIVPVIAQFTDNEDIMEKFIQNDIWFRHIPLLNNLSHNRIIFCEKRRDNL